MSKKGHLLVTCFEPYDEFLINSSQEAMQVAQEMRRSATSHGVDLISWRTLPVDFDEGPRILRDWLDEGFSYVIHLGQSPRSAQIQLETTGYNERLGPHDTAPSKLVEGGSEQLRSTLPLELFAEALVKQQLHAIVSHDAGRYLCNAVLYHSLEYSEKCGGRPQATFIHLPFTAEQAADGTPFLPKEDAGRAVLTCALMVCCLGAEAGDK